MTFCLIEQLPMIIPLPVGKKNCFSEAAVAFHQIINYSSHHASQKIPFYAFSFLHSINPLECLQSATLAVGKQQTSIAEIVGSHCSNDFQV